MDQRSDFGELEWIAANLCPGFWYVKEVEPGLFSATYNGEPAFSRFDHEKARMYLMARVPQRKQDDEHKGRRSKPSGSLHATEQFARQRSDRSGERFGRTAVHGHS